MRDLHGHSIALISNYSDFATLARYKENSKCDALILPCKSRIVSIYVQHTGAPLTTTNSNVSLAFNVKCAYFCSGTIVEEPSEENAWRYLVAYDQGAFAYLKPKNVYPCMDLFGVPENRLHGDHVHFLATQRERPFRPLLDMNMANTNKRGHYLHYTPVYFCGEWRKASLIDVDCSLVRVSLRVNFDPGLDHEDQMLATSCLGKCQID